MSIAVRPSVRPSRRGPAPFPSSCTAPPSEIATRFVTGREDCTLRHCPVSSTSCYLILALCVTPFVLATFPRMGVMIPNETNRSPLIFVPLWRRTTCIIPCRCRSVSEVHACTAWWVDGRTPFQRCTWAGAGATASGCSSTDFIVAPSGEAWVPSPHCTTPDAAEIRISNQTAAAVKGVGN